MGSLTFQRGIIELVEVSYQRCLPVEVSGLAWAQFRYIIRRKGVKGV
jgi:hypothetical protein